MDGFRLIQKYFSNLSCNFCQNSFDPDGIQLIREQQGYYVVSVTCKNCERHIGVAMVGIETQDMEMGSGIGSPRMPGGSKHRRRYSDPELTRKDRKRLAKFAPVSDDDVLDAHYFFQNLGSDWQRFIPEEMRQRYTAQNTESPIQ